MTMESEIDFDIDFDDAVAREVRSYVGEIVTGLGLRGDSSCIDAEPLTGAYVALDGRLPDFPGHYVALVWNELSGWSVAAEDRLGELVEVARLGGGPRPAPTEVIRWVEGLLHREQTHREQTRGNRDFTAFVPVQRGCLLS